MGIFKQGKCTVGGDDTVRKKIWEFLFVLENNSIFSSIKKGIMITYMIFLFGSVARLLYILPEMSAGGVLATWQNSLIPAAMDLLISSTEGCISLFLVISISYYYARSQRLRNPLLLLMAVTTATITFVMGSQVIGGSFYSQELFGVSCIALAVVNGIGTTWLFTTAANYLIKRGKLSDIGVESSLRISWMSVIPMLFTLIIAAMLYTILSRTISQKNLYDLSIEALIMYFRTTESELLNGLMYVFLLNFSWISGFHGGTLLTPVKDVIFNPASADVNLIISQGFIETFAQMGGSGAVLCLLLAMRSVPGSRAQYKKLRGSLTFVPFNISELIVFEYPIIFNPIIMIPFLVVPLLATCIAYWATALGIMPVVHVTSSWIIPAGFSGWYATGSLSGVIVQVISLVCGTLIYIPFVKLYNRFLEEKESRILELLVKNFQAHEQDGIPMLLLSRSDVGGQIAKAVAKQLRADIENHRIPIYYQPQMDNNDKPVGAEALLRWRYQGKLLYPPFVLAIAREDNLHNALALESEEVIAKDLVDIHNKIGIPLHISMNLMADQVDDVLFIRNLVERIKHQEISEYIYLELTEETALTGLKNLDNNISFLAENGISMAIDDFGMGQTSLNYLRENKFEYVKLDGSLVKCLQSQPRCSEIIASIVNLGESLQFQVIAEYVENKVLKDQLMELGCKIYQGYYYSPAIPVDELVEYCSARGTF